MGCGASSAAPLTVDVEAREGCDPRYDDLVGESPTLSNAFEKRRRFEAMMSEAMHGRATEGLGSAFDLWATHAYYQRTIKQELTDGARCRRQMGRRGDGAARVPTGGQSRPT